MDSLKGFKNARFGLHLHSTPDTWWQKIDAGYKGGCRLFDAALKGHGGCPMAKDELTGNIATENLIQYLKSENASPELDYDKLQRAMDYSVRIFG